MPNNIEIKWAQVEVGCIENDILDRNEKVSNALNIMHEILLHLYPKYTYNIFQSQWHLTNICECWSNFNDWTHSHSSLSDEYDNDE